MKLIKLYCKYFQVNFKTVFTHDYDFFIGLFGMIIKNIVNIIFVTFIFNILDSLQGWSLYEILFFYAASMISFAIWHCFFINTLTTPYYVKSGMFDFFLLKPVHSLFLIMVDGFDEDGWGDLLVGIALLMIAGYHLDMLNYHLLFLIVTLMVSSLIYAAFTIILSTLSFFTIDNSNITQLVSDIYGFAKYPLTIFKQPLRFVLSFLLPIAFTGFLPALYMFEDYQIGYLLLTIVMSLLFFIVAIIIWNKGVHRYMSSGS